MLASKALKHLALRVVQRIPRSLIAFPRQDQIHVAVASAW